MTENEDKLDQNSHKLEVDTLPEALSYVDMENVFTNYWVLTLDCARYECKAGMDAIRR